MYRIEIGRTAVCLSISVAKRRTLIIFILVDLNSRLNNNPSDDIYIDIDMASRRRLL